jgi:hypothetical protein
MADEILDTDELIAKLSRQLGPFEEPPSIYIPYHVKREGLFRAFAGVELGAWDQRVLSWLANADGDTVIAVLGMVQRAIGDAAALAIDDGAEPDRAAEYEQNRRAALAENPFEPPPS